MMTETSVLLCATAWQTVGPYFRIGLEPLYQSEIAGKDADGQQIRVEGWLLDGDGQPVPDAVLEVWQADAAGRYAQPDSRNEPSRGPFCGFGRVPTEADGTFAFSTIKPGPVHDELVGLQAPHLVITVMMRGLLRSLVTRAYFSGEPLNESDAILNLVAVDRRGALILHPSPTDSQLFLWTIHMQGPQETVFFDF